MKNIVEITEEKQTEFNGEKYNRAVITIKQLIGYGLLVFKEPVVINATQEVGSDIVRFYYDFGMSDEVNVADNFLFDYLGENKEKAPFKTTAATIAFDLNHAFFHYDGDPNFGHVHWALRAVLKNNLEKCVDWYDLPEKDTDSKI